MFLFLLALMVSLQPLCLAGSCSKPGSDSYGKSGIKYGSDYNKAPKKYRKRAKNEISYSNSRYNEAYQGNEEPVEYVHDF